MCSGFHILGRVPAVLDGVWGGTGRPQASGPPFTSLKILRTDCLDLIRSAGNVEVKMIKRLQYRIETCQLSSLEKIDTTLKIISNSSVCWKQLLTLAFAFSKFSTLL